jgi:hypothetical protein
MTDVAPKAAAALVPPRPNLGPEPFVESGSPVGWAVALTLVLLAVAAFVAANRRRRKRPSLQLAGEIEALAVLAQTPSPREQLIAQANIVRSALVDRFGESWRAKTTEEIAVELRILEAFDTETLERLLTFLRDADLAKFARELATNHNGTPQGWDDWVTEFVEAAGASSTIKGR